MGEDGVVYGVVSSLDLLRIVQEASDRGDSLETVSAEDAMTRDLVMVSPEATLGEVAATMLEHRIHRVLVGENRMLAGVITSFDLVRVVSHGPDAWSATPRPTGYSR